jgi:diaminohydroxyphosphoribosylaminopyrimidine deaminase / 5-amino-6-(5-phosphoribosylamino)uracil reductase
MSIAALSTAALSTAELSTAELDRRWMDRALELAVRGQGAVEPNPLVGCVIARGDRLVGEGWHTRFGGPHAEIEALRAAGAAAAGATLYVTLEPCCHHGKTPPCTDAVIRAAVGRVVVAQRDPFPPVAGRGLAQLREAGIPVDLGLFEREALALNAPYLKLIRTGRPWVLAKWAMTLDGKLATRTGHSRWISNPASRSCVHRLRGRVDAILVGRRTAELDDPLLTARPPGPRVATRIVVDSLARLALDSQLVRTAREVPVLVAAGPQAGAQACRRLQEAGCEVWTSAADDANERLQDLLDELGRRRMTNVLVEGGGQLLGSLLDGGEIDEVHVFLAAKLAGGRDAPTPMGGAGVEQMSLAWQMPSPIVERLDDDVYVHGRLRPAAASEGEDLPS